MSARSQGEGKRLADEEEEELLPVTPSNSGAASATVSTRPPTVPTPSAGPTAALNSTSVVYRGADKINSSNNKSAPTSSSAAPVAGAGAKGAGGSGGGTPVSSRHRGHTHTQHSHHNSGRHSRSAGTQDGSPTSTATAAAVGAAAAPTAPATAEEVLRAREKAMARAMEKYLSAHYAPARTEAKARLYHHTLGVVNPFAGEHAAADVIQRGMYDELGSHSLALLLPEVFRDPRSLRQTIKEQAVMFFHPFPEKVERRSRSALAAGSPATAAASVGPSMVSTPTASAFGGHRHADGSDESASLHGGGDGSSSLRDAGRTASTYRSANNNTVGGGGGGNNSSTTRRAAPLFSSSAVTAESTARMNHTRLWQAVQRNAPYKSDESVRGTVVVAGGDGTISFLMEQVEIARQELLAEFGLTEIIDVHYESGAEYVKHGKGKGEEAGGGGSTAATASAASAAAAARHELHFRNYFRMPAVAPLPLGTGNDYANCVGFGTGFTRYKGAGWACCLGESEVAPLLAQLVRAPAVPFDRWTASFVPLRAAQEDVARRHREAAEAAARGKGDGKNAAAAATPSRAALAQNTNNNNDNNKSNAKSKSVGQSDGGAAASTPAPLLSGSFASGNPNPNPYGIAEDNIANYVHHVDWAGIAARGEATYTHRVINYLGLGYDGYVTCHFDATRKRHPRFCSGRIPNKAVYGVMGLSAEARCEYLCKYAPLVVIPDPWPVARAGLRDPSGGITVPAAAASSGGGGSGASFALSKSFAMKRSFGGLGGPSAAGATPRVRTWQQQQQQQATSVGLEDLELHRMHQLAKEKRRARKRHEREQQKKEGKSGAAVPAGAVADPLAQARAAVAARPMVALAVPPCSRALVMTNVSCYSAGGRPWQPLRGAAHYTPLRMRNDRLEAIDFGRTLDNMLAPTTTTAGGGAVAAATAAEAAAGNGPPTTPARINDRRFELQGMGGMAHYGLMKAGLRGSHRIAQTGEMFVFVLCTPEDLVRPVGERSPYTERELRRHEYLLRAAVRRESNSTDARRVKSSMMAQADGEAAPRIAEATIIHVAPHSPRYRLFVRCCNPDVVALGLGGRLQDDEDED